MKTRGGARRGLRFGKGGSLRLAFLASLCLLSSLVLVPTGAGALPIGKALIPNLDPYPPYDIGIGDADGHDRRPPYALRFSVTVANRGPVAFAFQAKEPEEEGGPTLAMQCVRWIAKRICTHREQVGEFTFHEGHSHYHLVDYALYELRTVTAEGLPDMGPEGLVAGGDKVSFCLQDSDEADPKPLQLSNPITLLCLEDNQGISPGYADTYEAGLEGQQILVKDVPDGIYALVITIDPTHRFYEGPREDNVSYALIELIEGGSDVQVL